MEYIDGIKITDFEGIRQAGIDIDIVLQLIGEVYMEGMLSFGYFQADPHPGNLFALPGNRLAMLDFGLTKRFTPEFLAGFRELARAIYTNDGPGLVEGFKAAGFKYKHEHSTEAALALGESFRAFSSPETYRDKEIMDSVNQALHAVEKKNPTVDMPGEIALAMRVMGLFLALAFASGANVDFGEIVLRYANEPVEVAA